MMVAFERNLGLFWSNWWGWTGLGTADRFSAQETRTLRLPIGKRKVEWIAEEDAKLLVAQGIDDAR